MSTNTEENKLNLKNVLLLGIYIMVAQLTFIVSIYIAHNDVYATPFTGIAEFVLMIYTIIVIAYIAFLYIPKQK